MACALDKKLIERTIEFHGHNCPGLTIGIRAAELAMEELDIQNVTEPVCVTETDMCGVDAIQFLTGCSFGKGNLIHKDFGKSAFTFFDRESQNGFRAVFNNNFPKGDADKNERINQLMGADLSALFIITKLNTPPVRPARILNSIPCDSCGEMTMESRVRLFDGRHFCIPCFGTVEQKI